MKADESDWGSEWEEWDDDDEEASEKVERPPPPPPVPPTKPPESLPQRSVKNNESSWFIVLHQYTLVHSLFPIHLGFCN